MMSDVPLGAFCPAALTRASSSASCPGRQRAGQTFSIGFDEPAFDEPTMRDASPGTSVPTIELVVQPDGVSILDRLVSHFDEPFADASAIPTWYVSEMARRHVTVVLSGDGGDELFGGYDRYLPHPRVVAFDRYSPRALRRVAAIAAAGLPHGVRGKNFLRHVGRSERGRYLDAIRFFGADEKPALLTADIQQAIDGPDPEASLARHFERFARLPWPSQMMRFDAETYLPEDVLTKVDAAWPTRSNRVCRCSTTRSSRSRRHCRRAPRSGTGGGSTC